MRESNQKQLEDLQAKIKDAEENLGETEVRDAMHAKAEFLGRIGDREAAAKAYQETEEKTASGGSKADMIFSQTRLAMLYEDWSAVKKLLARGKQVCDAGGDWEHKNKLKVSQHLPAFTQRNLTLISGSFGRGGSSSGGSSSSSAMLSSCLSPGRRLTLGRCSLAMFDQHVDHIAASDGTML
eukprot:jgi/Chrzof1/14134/Cz08g26100.t1